MFEYYTTNGKIIFTLIFIKFGINLDTLFMWIICALLIIIAGTDIKEKVVFDVHTYSLIGVAVIFAITKTIYIIWQTHQPLSNLPPETFFFNPITGSILGILAGALIMEILARSGYLFVGSRAFGEGDTLIAAGIGAVFGWYQLIFILILSVIIQLVIYLPMFLKDLFCRKEWKTLISFSSFAIFAVLFFIFQNKLGTGLIYIIFTAILIILGILTCIFIFKGLREKPESRTYMPFGPAMVGAALFAIFFNTLLI